VASFFMSNIFSLHHPEVFSQFKTGGRLPFDVTLGTETHPQGTRIDGETWFSESMTYEFNALSEDYGCKVWLSRARLDQARKLWMDDIDRVRLDSSTTPDHFKQAGHLAYWLRRRLVTNSIQPDETSGGAELQEVFLNYGNEICAFRIGFSICLGFETRHLDKATRLALLPELILDHEFVVETAKLLHFKNVSPQALYLIYRSLFYDLRIPEATNVIPFASKATHGAGE
jgi:hypothetical protein